MPAKAYSGGCHCGKVRFDVTAELGQVISCNCSICTMRGSLLTALKPDQFVLRSGQDNLADYQFYKHVIHHLFCKTCGTQSFSRGTTAKGEERVAINVRCLDNVDLSALKVIPFDGKSL
jgi:hypothetical protein